MPFPLGSFVNVYCELEGELTWHVAVYFDWRWFSSPLPCCLQFQSVPRHFTAPSWEQLRIPRGAWFRAPSVTLTNSATNERRTATTGPAGDYRFVNLVPGTYQVRIAASGFQAYTANQVQVEVEQVARATPPCNSAAGIRRWRSPVPLRCCKPKTPAWAKTSLRGRSRNFRSTGETF